MDYRGHFIRDCENNVEKTYVTTVKGNFIDEIIFEPDEFSNFIKMLENIRKSLEDIKADEKEVIFTLTESPKDEDEIRCSISDDARIDIYVRTTVNEPEEKRAERIEKEKKEIDNAISLIEEVEKKQKDKYTKEAIEHLSELGYKIIHP